MRQRLLASVAVVLATGMPAAAQSLPTGGTVAAGRASITMPSGRSLVVNQASSSAVINWNTFSIGQGGTVAFNNGSGSTLNRVLGNVPSRIDGTLTATGSVYLVNPAGIAVGSGGQIATGGSFVASTLDIADKTFLAGGSLTFSGTSSASVANAGKIGSLGGDVALIARKVENTGTLTAPQGAVGLAAGYEVLVRDGALDGGRFQVRVGGADTEAKTSGRIKAAVAELKANGGNVYALAGNTTGVIAATGTATRGGRVYLTAGEGTVEASGKISATRTARNGATAGGDVRLSGKAVTVSGRIAARGKGGAKGGAKDGAAGGTVVVEGEAITLTGTSVVDVSGAVGGTLLVGGDYQGGADAATKKLSETVRSAATTTVEAGATLAADGTDGAGGAVVVWSNDATRFAGAISARGAGTADGGSAEVSGKGTLAFTGAADLRADNGRTGTLLLDPYNLTISTGSNSTVSGSSPFTAGGDDSVLNVTTLTDALATANVTVTTGTSADPGLQAGDITVAAPVSWSANTRLILEAAGNVVFNAPVTATGASAGLVIQYGAGKDYIVHAPITLSGASATLQIGATGALQDYTLIHDMAALNAINSTGLSGHYALAQSLDASGTTYDHALVGTQSDPFTGTFAGLGNTISNLTIAMSGNSAGLFGQTAGGAVLRDVGLRSGSVTGGMYVGALVGANAGGRITNTYATGNVSGSGDYVGGLAGFNSGSITNAYATGDVTSGGVVSGYVGGLVGYNAGSITNAYATGAVTDNHFNVSVGGLVGYNNAGSITNAYATGAVIGYFVGGLVGNNTGTIADTYATGAVTGVGAFAYRGGLVGFNQTIGSVAASFWDTVTSGLPGAIGGGSGPASVSPLDASSAYLQATYTAQSWDFANTWYLINGETRPFLRSEWSATISNSHQLQLMQMDPGASYALAADVDLSAVAGSANRAQMWNTDRGFVPVGTFTGTFDGAGHTIANLTINRGGADNVGLFGSTSGAVIRDVGLVGVNVSGHLSVGGLVGSSTGGTLVERSYVATGTITGTNFNAGGLLGDNNHSTVSQSYAGAAVNGYRYVGGLVGTNNFGTVSQSYATGDVTGTQTITGGLVGYNFSGTVTQSYATGDVSGNTVVGGLVGQNNSASGAVRQSYSTGAVSGTSDIGGLVGVNNGASVTDSYWDTTTSGRLNGIGSGTTTGVTLAGLTTAEFQDTTGFMARPMSASWDFDTTWAPPSDGYYPELYALTPVAWVKAIASASTYGDSTATIAGATAAGGPASYVFGPSNDSLSVAGGTVAVDPTTNAGAHTTGLTTQNVTTPSARGVAYRVFYYGDNTLTVNRAALTITASNLTKTYGQTPTPTGYTASGLQNDETIGSVRLTSAGAAATAAVSGSPYAITAGNAAGGTFDPANYTIHYEDGALTVNPAVLTIRATNLAKTYGQTAALTYTPSGLQNGETIGSVTLTSAGRGASASVAGGPYAITAGNAAGGTFDPANYTIHYEDGRLTVSPAVLTITATNLTKTYGQTAALTGYTVSGLKNDETLGSVTLTSAGRGASASVAGGPYAITASNATGGTFDPANYTIHYEDGRLTVSPAALTITATDLTKTYGQTPALTGYTVSGLKNDETIGSVTLTSAGQGASASVAGGPYAITADNATGGTFDPANYAIHYEDGRLTVNPAALTVTATNLTKTYGQTATLTYTPSGLQNGETIGSVTLTSAGRGASASVAGGPYAVTASNATGGTFDPANYAIHYEDGRLTVNPAALTVTATNLTKTYGQTATLTYTPSGLQNGETIGSVTLTSTGQGASASVAGEPYEIFASNATGGTFDPANYAISYMDGRLTVNRAALTVTASDLTKTYGQTPALTGYIVSGLLNGETLGSVMLTSAGQGASASVAGGPYAITASTATGGTFDPANYAIHYVDGALTVNPAVLTVTAKDLTKTYGQTATLTYTPSGLQNGETIGSVMLTSAGQAASASVAGGPYGIFASTAAGGTFDPANYTISYVDGRLTVTPRPITIAADDQQMRAGMAVPPLSWTVVAGDLVNGDAFSGALATDATSASPPGSYAILQGTLAAASNYVLTYLPGVLSVTAPGRGLTSQQIALLTRLTPGQFVQTTAPDALVQFSQTGESGSPDGEAGNDCVADVVKATCLSQPHPDNMNYGRFLHFSAMPRAGR